MKQLILIILLSTAIFGQSGKSVLTRAQKDSIGAMINDSSYTVNAKSFGVVGDGITDDYSALQAALDYCLTGNKRTLILEAGKTYSISRPLMILSFNGSSWSYAGDIHILGDSPPYASLTTLKQAKIQTTYNDLPAIIIQNGRNIIIENIYLQGKNNFTGDYKTLFEGGDGLYVASGVRDNRYSPHCGIAIDPFRNTYNSDSYPGLSYYYTGLGSSGSSHIKIKNVYFYQFVVGLMATSGSVSQGEQVLVEDCNFQSLKVAWAVGQPQSKNCYMIRPTVYNVNTMIDCANYGNRIGAVPYVIGGNLTTIKALYRVGSLTYNTQVHISDVFGELIYALGYFSGINPVTFTGCQIKFFVYGSGEDNAYEPTVVLYSTAPVYFNGCYLGKYNNTSYRLSMYTQDAIFTNCTFDDIPFVGNINNYLNISYQNCYFRYSGKTNVFIPFTSGFSSYTATLGFDGKYIPPYAKFTNGNTVYTDTYNFDKHSFTIDHLTTTIGYTRDSDKRFIFNIDSTGKIQTGDMVVAYYNTQPVYNTITLEYDSGVLNTVQCIVGKVDSIVGNRVVLIGSPKLDSTTYILGIWRLPLFHQRNFGDVTNGSNIITNCTSTSSWTVGQRIKGYGIPANAYVTEKTSTTLTISLYATSSRTQCNLYDAYYWIERRTYAIPTSGGWTLEDRVEYRPNSAMSSVSELGSSPNKYTLKGWKRLTYGTNNVLNTDWVEERIPTGN